MTTQGEKEMNNGERQGYREYLIAKANGVTSPKALCPYRKGTGAFREWMVGWERSVRENG